MDYQLFITSVFNVCIQINIHIYLSMYMHRKYVCVFMYAVEHVEERKTVNVKADKLRRKSAVVRNLKATQPPQSMPMLPLLWPCHFLCPVFKCPFFISYYFFPFCYFLMTDVIFCIFCF